MWGIGLVIVLFYAYEMGRCINLPGPERRLFSGWWALLVALPYLYLVANFIIVWAVDKSLRREANARGIPEPNNRLWMGMVMSTLLALITFQQFLNLAFAAVAGLGAVVFWILWWRWAYKQRGRIEDAPIEQPQERREPTNTL